MVKIKAVVCINVHSESKNIILPIVVPPGTDVSLNAEPYVRLLEERL
jgi:hypothetical protein